VPKLTKSNSKILVNLDQSLRVQFTIQLIFSHNLYLIESDLTLLVELAKMEQKRVGGVPLRSFCEAHASVFSKSEKKSLQQQAVRNRIGSLSKMGLILKEKRDSDIIYLTISPRLSHTKKVNHLLNLEFLVK
jgi:hypothetical protein